jgi:hypothetical protein
VGIRIGSQSRAVGERNLKHAIVRGCVTNGSADQVLDWYRVAVLIETYGVTNVRIEARLRLGSQLKHDSLVLFDRDNRPVD